MMTLCLLFGVTHTVASLYIRFARRLIYRILVNDEHARVKLPRDNEVAEFKRVFKEKHSLLTDVYCVADGCKLYLQQSGDCVIQSMFYNGWKSDHFVGNVFVFAPNGRIIACAVNVPGAFHDSTIAEWGGVYKKLEKIFNQTGGTCVVDSAFSRDKYPFLIKSAQDHLMAGGNAEQIMLFRQATSARQASEWGMRSFQGTFPRLKDRMIYEEGGERKLILLTTVLLFNLRADLVGVSQILSTYMPHMSVEANLFLHDTFRL